MTVSSVGDRANCCAGFRGLTLLNSRQRLVILLSPIQFLVLFKTTKTTTSTSTSTTTTSTTTTEGYTNNNNTNNDRKGQDYVYVKKKSTRVLCKNKSTVRDE